MNRRRKVLAALGLGALAGTRPALGQQPAKVFRVGLLHVGNDHKPPSYEPLLEGMRALGYVEGRNIRYDFQNVADNQAALDAARAFGRERVDMVIAFDQEACDAAHKASTTIPIVMINVANAVEAGFAKSLAYPGGNMTGFAGRAEMAAKELEILKDMGPKIARVLLLFDPRDPGSIGWREDARTGARVLGMALLERGASDANEIDAVFAKLKPGDAQAVTFASASLRHRRQMQVLALAQKHGMPMVGSRKEMVEKGALFAYSYDFAKVGRLAASRYVDRILKGKKPADLPIEEFTEYQLTVSRPVATRYGLTFSLPVLLRAETVIE